MQDRTCVDCGLVLTKKPGPGRWPKRCPECKVAWRFRYDNERPRRSGSHRSLGVKTCAWCGHDFKAQTDRTTFCSRRCAGSSRAEGTASELRWEQCKSCGTHVPRRSRHKCVPSSPVGSTVDCPWCDKTFTQRTARQVYCGDHCRQAFHYTPNRSRIFIRDCAWCEDVFVTRFAGRRCCSKTCRKRNEGKFWVPASDRANVYERDSWVCQLCGKRVRKDLPVSDDRAASLDHILPRSLGGTDDIDNLQLAHRICNSIKGTGVFNSAEQLRLVG